MVQHVSEVVKIAGQVIERSTLAGLKAASAKSGISFQYLVAKAAQESNLKADARARPRLRPKGCFSSRVELGWT